MKNKKQLDLFSKETIKEDWEKEWKDMPEFVHEDNRAHKQIVVSFRNEEDYKQFSELINQRLSSKTKSVWFPRVNKNKPSNYLYVDGETNEDKS